MWLKGNAGGEVVGVVLGNVSVYASTTVTPTLTTSWQRVTLSWTAPPSSGGQPIYLTVRSAAAAIQTWFVDAAACVPGVVAPNYFDGDSPGYQWSGTAGNSTSSQTAVPLTHRGSYRVWARVLSPSQPSVRFAWGVGSLAAPVYNDAVQLALSPTASGQLIDLGEIRLDAPPVGPMQWFGTVQALADPGGTTVQIDELAFQPLDDGGGRLIANSNVPPSIQTTPASLPLTGADSTGAGTIPWINPTFIQADDGFATAAGFNANGQISHTLQATNFGFAIPTTATILGIMVRVKRWAQVAGRVIDASVKLTSPGTADKKITTSTWTTGPSDIVVYGGSNDLWGGAFTPANLNASTFGVSFSATLLTGSGAQANVDAIYVSVYYTLASGIVVVGDAVMYATTATPDQVNCVLSTDGMFRNDPTGTVYGEVSRVIGDLPRLPVSGMENRPVEVFLRLSPTYLGPSANPDVLGPKVNNLRVYYRPSYLFPP